MLNAKLCRFLCSEDGAVTVDWVVLTGGIMLFGVLTTRAVIDGTTDASSGIGAILDNAVVPTVSIN